MQLCSVLTWSPACVCPEPQSCKHLHSLGCEVPLEKPVILCRPPAPACHTSDSTGGAASSACAFADALVMRRGQQSSAVALRQPDQHGAACIASVQTLLLPCCSSPPA